MHRFYIIKKTNTKGRIRKKFAFTKYNYKSKRKMKLTVSVLPGSTQKLIPQKQAKTPVNSPN